MGEAEAKAVQRHFLTVLDANDVEIEGNRGDTLCLLRGNDCKTCKIFLESQEISRTYCSILIVGTISARRVS